MYLKQLPFSLAVGAVSFAVGALALSACSKDVDATDETDTTAADEDTGETGGSGGDKGDEASTTNETTADTDEGFVPDEDFGAANSCDPWLQDCPEGEKCVAYDSTGDTWDANKCVQVMGTGTTGDECTYFGAIEGTDDCDVGYMCYYTDTEGLGICIPLCTGTPDNPQCPQDFNCSVSNDGSLLLCVYSCNPVLQDCEQVDSGCFWDGSQFNCDPAGDLLEGDPCGYINDCSPGHICLDAEALPACNGSACCSGFCDLADPTCTVAETECIAFFEPGQAPPGYEDVGICALPGA